MFELLIAPGRKLPPTDDISLRIIGAQIEDRKHLANLLQGYDGGASSFPYIILDTVTRQSISQSKLAELCETSSGSVSRWMRGAVPTRLTRIAAAQRIREMLVEQINVLQGLIGSSEPSDGFHEPTVLEAPSQTSGDREVNYRLFAAS